MLESQCKNIDIELAKKVQKDNISQQSDIYQDFVETTQSIMNLNDEYERLSNQLEFLTDAMSTQMLTMPGHDEEIKALYTPTINEFDERQKKIVSFFPLTENINYYPIHNFP